ncbi:hypothetical protein BYT27DRAFT_7195850 [Phlegmacium glaucopus]|nr:hypothetical protein BYT27DRAFT_7195850 [Phlegmacium glaucopus]
MPDILLNGKLYGYHSLTALTENAINRQFEELYDIADPDDPLKHLVVTQKVQGKLITTMDCKLGYSKAVLDVAPKVVKTSILFHIKFDEGYFLVATFTGPKRYEIKDWELVFYVNLDIQASTDPTPEHKKILKRLEDAGFGKPGDYSIGQLLFDFTAADISKYRKDLSHMPAFDTTGKTPEEIEEILEAQGAFNTYMETYMLRLTKPDPSGRARSVIGYIPLAIKQMPATLAPTKLRFNTYPYDDGKTNPGFNLFFYLEMTNNADFPPVEFQRSINWISPGGAVPDGCVALSKEIFLDGWMMSRLKEINKQTFIYFERSGNELKLTKPTSASPFKYQGYMDEMGSKFHSWAYEDVNEVSNGAHKGWSQVRNYITVMVAPVDACTIVLGGTTRVRWSFSFMKYEGLQEWSTTLRLKAIDETGRLSFEIDPVKDKFGIVVDEGGVDKAKSAISNSLKEEFLAAWDTDALKKAMRSFVDGSYPFYFGQGNDYFLKNPLFNIEGALVCELKSKGPRGFL